MFFGWLDATSPDKPGLIIVMLEHAWVKGRLLNFWFPERNWTDFIDSVSRSHHWVHLTTFSWSLLLNNGSSGIVDLKRFLTLTILTIRNGDLLLAIAPRLAVSLNNLKPLRNPLYNTRTSNIDRRLIPSRYFPMKRRGTLWLDLYFFTFYYNFLLGIIGLTDCFLTTMLWQILFFFIIILIILLFFTFVIHRLDSFMLWWNKFNVFSEICYLLWTVVWIMFLQWVVVCQLLFFVALSLDLLLG